MTYQPRTNTCIECESTYEMVRLDQRFCRRKCRNTFNNRSYRNESQNTKVIDGILHANRKILEKLESDTISKNELLKLGFNFRFITEIHKENGLDYFGCYNYWYSVVTNKKKNEPIIIKIYSR